jgi:hypothetical protein
LFWVVNSAALPSERGENQGSRRDDGPICCPFGVQCAGAVQQLRVRGESIDRVERVEPARHSTQQVGVSDRGRVDDKAKEQRDGSGGVGDVDRRPMGDYFGIARDPADARTVWSYGEYAGASNTWRTRVNAAKF